MRVSKAHPCTQCQRGDWCTYTADGRLAFCMRVPSDRQAKNGAYIHVLAASTSATYVPPPPPPPRSVAARLFSASAYMTRLDGVTERYDIDGLAVSLGVDVTALAQLGTRYDVFTHAFAFPMRDGDGNTVGVRLRDHDGRKWAVTHSKQGLFYDLAVDAAVASMVKFAPKLGRALFVCEGPTDTAAAMTLGFAAVGRPSCMGGVDELRVLMRRVGVRRLVVVSDNDEAKRRPDGSVWYPGKEGARAMVTALGCEHKMLVTPTKDVRKWVCAGATRRDVMERLELMDWR
jgi:hypothetical protein